MAIWFTRPPGDPGSIGHLEHEDFYGRPSRPLCGTAAAGLWYGAATTWDQVPEAQRCTACEALGGPPPPPAAP